MYRHRVQVMLRRPETPPQSGNDVQTRRRVGGGEGGNRRRRGEIALARRTLFDARDNVANVPVAVQLS